MNEMEMARMLHFWMGKVRLASLRGDDWFRYKHDARVVSEILEPSEQGVNGGSIRGHFDCSSKFEGR